MLSLILQIARCAPNADLSVKSVTDIDGNQIVFPISFPHFRRPRPGREMVGIAVHGVSPDEEWSDGVSRWQGAGQTGADRLRRRRIPFAPRCAGAMIFAGA
jgi:hypothetical protein